ncbi:hypothetical protein CC117_14450 [Parafrankia colletiae]|uniref:Tetratricopeptide repeat protein n=1 Tax=Parafrankia colletiae TaxID=573497 RepID=A0A1S1R1K7_9ACTN|nr:tetratricopeptide repeat protein [Parafrankia colletiae]MCK9898620.1 tetratricopeptide repeat protein [Frankia sp. Cpl3]OHV39415.1 hypothetical protein CC117_14450 [Parafrankia colletiae]
MSSAEVMLAVLLGLAVNECCDMSPWIGRIFARWAARLRYADPLRAHVRAEELAAHIDARPGKLLKLVTACWLLTAAGGAALRRVVSRVDRADGVPTRHGAAAWRADAIESLAQSIYAYTDIRGLSSGGRRRFRALTRLLLHLVHSPASAFERGSREDLLALIVHTGGVLAENRDARAGAQLVAAARHHVVLVDADQPVALGYRFVAAMAQLHLGRPEQAERELRDVLGWQTRVLGPGHPETVESCRYLAWSLLRQGRPGEAEAVFRDLAAVLERSTGTTVAQRLHFECMYAWLHSRRERWNDSVTGYRRVIDGRAALLGPLHPDTLDACHSLAQVLLAMDDLPGARDLCAHVVVARRRIFGSRHPDTLESRKFRAVIAARIDRRRIPIARLELRRVLRAQTSRLGGDHPNTRDTREHLAALDRPPAE